MRVLVVGATGRTGRCVVETAIATGHQVRALVRSANPQPPLPQGVEVVVGNLGDRASLEAALIGMDAVISAAGATPNLDPLGPFKVDYLGTTQLIDLAGAACIQRFVLVSSLCVSRLLHPLNLFWLVLFWKRRAERYLQSSDLSYTIVRPGGLRSDRTRVPLKLTGPDQLFEGSLPRLQVAEVAVEALTNPAAANRIVEIVGDASLPERSPAELLSA
ncbi:SDR family oxidoreductase [Synechococcus elongatus IITB4]|uniref:SDR family oxidoreductase n=1 Tax=Synechococcus elongatus TaxID=32046 RepID=UPI0030D135E3